MSALFSALKLRGMAMPNRIVVSPMCQYSAVDGRAQEWHRIHLGQFALSGAGLTIIEATAVEARGRITPGCLGLYDDATEHALGEVLRSFRAVGGGPVALQIGHAGRKGSSAAPWDGGQLLGGHAGGWPTCAPSALAPKDGEPLPHELSAVEIDRILDAFVATVGRASRLGIDAIEVHAAHGYLLHQFLSPLSNRRTDSYGASLENRMRFPLAVVDAARRAWPADRPLGVRISATDWVDDSSWNLAESTEFARRCVALGADWIDVSSGGVDPQRQRIAVGPGYQVPFAKAVRAATGAAVMAVGLITEPGQAEAIVAAGDADLVALGRAMLYDPRWPWHAAAALGATIDAPPPYWRAPPAASRDVFGKTRFGMR